MPEDSQVDSVFPPPEQPEPPPFTLWIDSEGGFLVVPKSRAVVGQADPDRAVDVPIVADLEAQHLIIHRGGGGFQIEPIGEVYVAGRRVREVETIVSGDILTLSGGVQLRLETPNPLSGSARLVILSRHRTRPWSDGVLLMSDALLVGPSPRDHVRCRTWEKGLVLHRRGEELLLRFPAPLEIDGRIVTGPSVISTKSRVHGPDFSFSLEPMSVTDSSEAH